ncbi:aspartate/tyrosine/aromatic aminotransferase [Pusillimonas sp. CC-YST705]|uniref:Aminotransferase n=1 Tax=Mesopusillimonas faecipullorum TaxID=2755040 RepID=A0ABS8CDC2_9BURK|nr:amino acid aminotransferase [Mesopusillimonas faecipullorum]MCB5364041.1 aspartate/tyrosine/aromatic aminotransferase [Mesopusillimonas faecipullorum]
MSSLFAPVELAPRDPILGLTEQFNADTRTQKVNLGVGVYGDENGRLPLLQAVQQAEARLLATPRPRGYQPIDGAPAYNKAAQALLLGSDHAAITEGRAVTVQTLGGTGALKIGADFLRQWLPQADVVISNPSWENHRAIFERAGFNVGTYPYYDADSHGLDFEGMVKHLESLPAGTIVVLHACCHNPTGVDPTPEQWQRIAAVVQSRGLLPFIDMAYQGFGDGLQEDAATVRLFAGLGINVVISSSFSKSFSLYGERVGALTLLTTSADESARVLSQLKRTIRTNYSNPPTHGSAIVSTVLNTPELAQLWEQELAQMRNRIRDMRGQLVSKLAALGVQQDFSFILSQRGMFSYSGLSPEQVARLCNEFGIYAVGTGRICVSALNPNNLDYVAQSVAQVYKTSGAA